MEEFDEIAAKLAQGNSKDDIAKAFAEQKVFKAAVMDLLSMCKAATGRLTHAAAATKKRDMELKATAKDAVPKRAAAGRPRKSVSSGGQVLLVDASAAVPSM